MVLSGDALGTAGDSTGRWPLLGLFICSRLQTLDPETTTSEKKKKKKKKKKDWLKNRPFFYNWEISGDFG